jgi:hypothetical protein
VTSCDRTGIELGKSEIFKVPPRRGSPRQEARGRDIVRSGRSSLSANKGQRIKARPAEDPHAGGKWTWHRAIGQA